jgi:hypothetical protein
MKEMLFTKDESKFIKDLLRNYISVHKPLTGKTLDFAEKLLKKFERAETKIKVSSAKGKGRGLQYWVCDRIAKMFGLEFIQSDDNCLVHSREMGQHGTDIVLRGKVFDDFPFDIECKSCESLSIPEWVRQARANKKENRDWLLVFKKQTIGHEPLVLMEWETFEKIIKDKIL